MHGETQCKLLLWNACFWHNFIKGVLQFTKQYGVMLTTSVLINSLVSLYSRQEFWFWHIFRCSSFYPNVFASILLYSIKIDKILFYVEWTSLKLYDLQEEILSSWIWYKVLGNAWLYCINTSKEEFYFSLLEKRGSELWFQIIIFIFFNVRYWDFENLLSHL